MPPGDACATKSRRRTCFATCQMRRYKLLGRFFQIIARKLV
jgi:hypothetical protein